jgi:hypothetical protein
MIRILYFAGGNSSFATRFYRRFPIGFGNGGYGESERQVPMAMVALVATAVSVFFLVWYVEKANASTSYMHLFMSGVLAVAKLWSSPQVHIAMFIMVISIPLSLFKRSVAMLTTQ